MNLILRAAQSILGFFVLSLQLSSVSNSGALVLTFLIIGFAGLADAAEGSKFIQSKLNHYENLSHQDSSNFDFVHEYIYRRRYKLILIILINNVLLICALYLGLFSKTATPFNSILLAAITVNSINFLLSLTIKVYVAYARLQILLLAQLVGVLVQLSIQIIINHFVIDPMIPSILNFGTPGLIVLTFSFFSLKRNFSETSERLSDSSFTTISSRESILVQSFQFLHAAFLFLLPLLAYHVLDDVNFLMFGILFKAFLILANVVGINLVSAWITQTNLFFGNSKTKFASLDGSNSDLHVWLQGILTSLLLIIAGNFVWDKLFEFSKITSPLYYFIWMNFAGLQLLIWKYFYRCMNSKSYVTILSGAFLQIFVLFAFFLSDVRGKQIDLFFLIDLPLLVNYLFLKLGARK